MTRQFRQQFFYHTLPIGKRKSNQRTFWNTARKIAISEQDRKDYEIVEKKEEKRIEWNVQKDAETPLVVEFSKEELDYMRRSCEAIAEQQMPDEMWAVVERIYNEAQN